MVKANMSVKEWLKRKKYIGRVMVKYFYREKDGDGIWTTRNEEVECVLCDIDGEYGVVRLSDNQLEWNDKSIYTLGNTKVTITETFDEFVDDFVTGLLYDDDLAETNLIDSWKIIEEVD